MQSGKDIYDFPDFEGVYETIVEQPHTSSAQNEVRPPQLPIDGAELSIINAYYMPVDSLTLSIPPMQGVSSDTYNSAQLPSHNVEANRYCEPQPSPQNFEANDYCDLQLGGQSTGGSVAGTYYSPVDLKDSVSVPGVGVSNGKSLGYQNLMLLPGNPYDDEPGLTEGDSTILQKNHDDSKAKGAWEGDVDEKTELPPESVRLSACNTYATPRSLVRSSDKEGESEHFMDTQHGSQANGVWEENINKKGAYQELFVLEASENEYERLKVLP